MRTSTIWLVLALCPALAAITVLPLSGRHAAGQDDSPGKKTTKKTAAKSKKKGAIANVNNLDVRAEELQKSFTKEVEELAGQYFDAGHLEKAKNLLKAAQTLNPESPALQQKLKALDEAIISANNFTVDLKPERGWQPAKAIVEKDQAVRFQVEGTYRFVANATVGAAGFPEKDPNTDMTPGIPCGALMGVVLQPDGKPGKPFLIGEGGDHKPKETGVLMLRVNSPPDCKHSGKLTILLSGHVLPP